MREQKGDAVDRFCFKVLVVLMTAATSLPAAANTEAGQYGQDSEPGQPEAPPAGADPELSAPDNRWESIELSERSQGLIVPYKPNYVLPVTYMQNPNNDPLDELGESEEFENVEMKFQISFMLKTGEDLLFNNGDLYFAYSQISFWQAYTSDLSEAFRDTNYEPEFFLMFDTDFNVLGLHTHFINVGFVHQSNGRGNDVLTRSWNRVYAAFMMDKGNFTLGFKPWLVVDDDENPDIENYLGYGELRGIYKAGVHQFSVMLRNNLRLSDNLGAVEAG
jgi:phospholipase A1